MIKVLLLIPTLDRSGAEKQLTLLATRLPRTEFDVRVVLLTRGGPYEEELAAHHVPVIHLRKRFKFDPFAWRRLRNLLRDEKPDVLHTWLFAGNAYGRLAAGASPSFPIVVSERCVDSWKAGWQLRVDQFLIPRTTRLVGNSQSVAEFYGQLGVPADKLQVIPNGIDLPEAVTDREALRREFDIPPGSLVVGFVGRLAAQKRVEDLIWAFELLRVMHGEVYFLLAGEGPQRESLEQFARGLNIEQRIRFLGQRQDVLRWLPACHLFWLASSFEGMSNSLMEAMASGIPVVASDIAPNRELVVPNETGYLVPVGDRAAFAQFAQKILQDETLAARLGNAGRERIRQHFSVEGMVARYAELYRSLVGSGSATV